MSTVSFKVVLNRPGDKYFFTVDVVNDGSIEAMIESIEKEPELTAEQAKYLKYEVSYANGENINTKQLVKAGDFVRVKVSLEYRSDINPEDIPTSQQVLNLSIKLNYTQADNSGTTVNNYGTGLPHFEHLTGEITGSELCLGEECFYVLTGENSEDESYVDVVMISKYNLFVGNEVTYYDPQGVTSSFNKLSYSVVKQDSRALGLSYGTKADGTVGFNTPFYGTVAFSDTMFWEGIVNDDSLVLNYSNNLIKYLVDYKIYLANLGYEIDYISIPTADILSALGCTMDSCTYDFLNSTSYWISYADNNMVAGMEKDGGIAYSEYNNQTRFGIRPVVIYRFYNS